MSAALDALDRLREGNRRFVEGMRARPSFTSQAQRSELMKGQKPFAIVLGCSDSRVPAELVFDQGVGDLFVIRVAGNIVAASQVGSIELAAEKFDTRLIVVLGHSDCSAVSATLSELERPAENRSPNLRFIVDHIRPAVEALVDTDLKKDHDALVRCAVRANIRASVRHLQNATQALGHLSREEGLVVGAEYSLETGIVEFLEDTPA